MGMLAWRRAPSTEPEPRDGGDVLVLGLAAPSCGRGVSSTRRRNCWLFMVAVCRGRGHGDTKFLPSRGRHCSGLLRFPRSPPGPHLIYPSRRQSKTRSRRAVAIHVALPVFCPRARRAAAVPPSTITTFLPSHPI